MPNYNNAYDITEDLRKKDNTVISAALFHVNNSDFYLSIHKNNEGFVIKSWTTLMNHKSSVSEIVLMNGDHLDWFLRQIPYMKLSKD